jgi:hypothetical protein
VPDTLATSELARRIELAVPKTDKGLKLALDPTGTKVAYAAPDGLYVADLGGTARKVAEFNGSVREMAWTPDGNAVVLSENEVEASCVPGLGGSLQCSSSSADDFARLEKVAIADGQRTLLRAHVYGLHDLTLSADHAVFIGAAEAGTLGQWRGVQTVKLADGTNQVLAPQHRVTRFGLSPDGKQVAILGPKSDQPDSADEVLTADVAGDAPKVLGDAPDRNYSGPFWNADGTTVRLLSGLNARVIPVAEFPLAGSPGHFDLPLPENVPGTQFLYGAPDGTHVLATVVTGFGGDRQRQIISLDLDKKQVAAVLPGAEFDHWVGKGPRFVSTTGNNWPSHTWYLVTP